MPVGNNTHIGLAVPLNGQSEIKQTDVAIDMLTLTGKSGQTADFLVARNSAGTEKFVVDANGYVTAQRIAFPVLTTAPTTGLTKGEVFVVFPTADAPSIGVCISTAANTIKYVGGWTSTAGRQT